MKSRSLGTPSFIQQNQDAEPASPDSEVLSFTTCCAREANKTPETSPREGRGGVIQVEGRLVIKAWKIHDVLGDRTDNSPHVARQWNPPPAGPDTSPRLVGGQSWQASSRSSTSSRATLLASQPCASTGPVLSQPVTSLILDLISRPGDPVLSAILTVMPCLCCTQIQT